MLVKAPNELLRLEIPNARGEIASIGAVVASGGNGSFAIRRHGQVLNLLDMVAEPLHLAAGPEIPQAQLEIRAVHPALGVLLPLVAAGGDHVSAAKAEPRAPDDVVVAD